MLGGVKFFGGIDCTTGVAVETEMLSFGAGRLGFTAVSWRRTVRSPAASEAEKVCVRVISPGMSTQDEP
jgi:hypothetical protein